MLVLGFSSAKDDKFEVCRLQDQILMDEIQELNRKVNAESFLFVVTSKFVQLSKYHSLFREASFIRKMWTCIRR